MQEGRNARRVMATATLAVALLAAQTQAGVIHVKVHGAQLRGGAQTARKQALALAETTETQTSMCELVGACLQGA